MLPKINVTPTQRKTISLKKRSINKIYSQFPINHITSTQSKRHTSESPHNIISHDTSKRSKILNISTKNNTTSNSNFNDNLYYYPPHNKKFSYISNLSSEVNLIYGDFNFNKAPSVKQNFSGIKKIIQDRRSKKINFLDNLFSMSLFINKQSQCISAKNNTIHTKEIYKPIPKNKIFSWNNSYGDLLSKDKDKDKEKMDNLKSLTTTRHINDEIKNYTAYNKTTTSRETVNINPPTTNPETIRLPDLSAKEEPKDNINNTTTKYPKNNSFITSLNTKKLNFDINDCIFESNRKIKNITVFAKKVLHMKIFQGIQKTTLDSFIDTNFNQLRKYINHIEINFEKYMKICKEYNDNFLNYIHFLKRKIIELDKENKSLSGQEMQLGFEVDNVLSANIRTQKELEKLIDMRNFLYKVRHKDETIPNIYSTFFIESKRYLLGQLIYKLFGDYHNVAVMRYLNAIKSIPKRNSIDPSKFIVEHCPPLVKDFNPTIQKNKNIKEEQNKNSNVFTSHEEFINVLKFLEDRNRLLINKNKNTLDTIEKYKVILENGVSHENIEYEERMMNIIGIKEKELDKIKRKHLMLLQKYDKYYAIVSKEDLFTQKNSNQKIHDQQKSSFQDLTYFQTINYNLLIKRAKHPGLIFFRKLLKDYLTVIKLYSNEIPYKTTHPEDLEEIISFSLHAEKNPKFSYFLIRYILKLLQLYEVICDYTHKKDQLYKLSEKNLDIMKKQRVDISDKRKLDNARTLRKLITKQRLDNDKKLIEKWKLPMKYVGRKNYIGNYCRDLVRAKSKETVVKKIKIIKKKFSLDDDLNEFLDLNE